MSNIIYNDGSMASVRAVDGTHVKFPFIEDGDTETKVYSMVCTQLASSYEASQVALDTPMTSAAAAGLIKLPFDPDPNAYFVGDTGHTAQGGGMISFTRTFSHIPKTTVIPSGTEDFTFPGILQGYNTIESIKVISSGTSNTDDDWIVNTVLPHGIPYPGSAPIYLRNIAFINEFGDRETVQFTGTTQTSDTGIWRKHTAYPTSPYEFILYQFHQTGGEGLVQVESGEVKVNEGTAYNLSNVSMNLNGPGLAFQTSVGNRITVGSQVTIDANFTVGRDGFNHAINGKYTVLDVDNKDSTKKSSMFIVDVGLSFEKYEALNLTVGAKVWQTGYERKPVSLYTPTFTRYEYFLPGVSKYINDPLDIKTQNPFRVIDTGTGDIVDTTVNESLRKITTTQADEYNAVAPTIPNCTSYLSMLGKGSQLVIDSSIQKWAGNIYVRKTKTVRAL